MGLFTPVKKHANKFRYTPRYYDPEKERREQRRRELHGTSSEQDGVEYQPGQYIRTQRDARRLARGNSEGRKKLPSLTILVLLATAVVVIYMLYPRITALLSKATQPKKVEVVQEEKEFDPYAPITIVPNDYKEE